MANTKHFGALAAAAGALVAVALLVLMMALVNPQTAGAAVPGTNGRIAYTGFDGNDEEIYTIDPTGGMPFQVTNNTTSDSWPSYSPDGEKIAYRGSDGNDSEIYTIDATGGTPFNVTDNNTYDYYPSWGSQEARRGLRVGSGSFVRPSEK